MLDWVTGVSGVAGRVWAVWLAVGCVGWSLGAATSGPGTCLLASEPPAAVLAEDEAGQSESVAGDFSVVVCNIENLFDVDGVSLFEDYGPEAYRPRHLLRKLQNHVKVLRAVNAGQGPEIILFQEIEADQSPGDQPFDWDAFRTKYAGTSLEELLSEPIDEAVKDLPAEAFLWKALQEAGLGEYQVAVGQYRPDPTGRVVAHVNATFSRFPIVSQRTHHTAGARGILEVVHDVDGAQLTTFNNHWKSGASDSESEQIRWGNAETLRRRLDVLLAADPMADIVLGGDFNSQHNQSEAYPDMTKTAINTILGSQGDELKIRDLKARWLYNLWYELPVKERGSDVYRDQWGTLMQLLLTRGLYQPRGVHYVDNSFEVLVTEGLNAQFGSRMPLRWAATESDGAGFSDHFPVVARFRRGSSGQEAGGYLSLENPSRGEAVTGFRSVDFSQVERAEIPRLEARFADDKAIQQLENLGQVFEISGEVSGERPFRMKVYDQEYNVWSFDVDMRREIYGRYQVGDPIRLIGEVGVHQGKWQFVVRDLGWLKAE